MSEKIRIHAIAKEIGFTSKDLLEKINELGLDIKSASSGVDAELAEAICVYATSGEIPTILQKEIDKKTKKSTTKAAKETKTDTKEVKETKKEAVKEEVKPKAPEELTIKKDLVKEEKQENSNQAEDTSYQEEKPTLAGAALQKRRGLVIVKKKKEEEQPTPKQEEKNLEQIFESNKNIQAMLGSSDDATKKKKKDKKHPQAIKKENAQKMSLLDDKDFADFSDDDDDDNVFMPDFSYKEIKEDEDENISKSKGINNKVFYKNSVNNSLNQFTQGSISRSRRKKAPKQKKTNEDEVITNITIPKEIRLYEFAEAIGRKDSELIAKLFMQGLRTTKNDFLDEETLEILGLEFGVEIEFVDERAKFDYVADYEEEQDEQNLSERAPVVTIMGHVDHGKTSLLDYIRSSRVASGEAGGITQHVGAYMVERNGKKITFIDTPGHEAFSAMRERGASVTDIVIIVVAADDGVKQQTKEALSHAKAAGVPIIIAVNKIDKETANIERVKTQLAENDILCTEWGGEYELVGISAKTGAGIDELLEIVLLQAELLELKADKTAMVKANIVESSIQKGRGVVATVIVQNGSIKVGDTIVAGVAYGRVKSLFDDMYNPLEKIEPGECGIVVGLSEIPDSGETLISVKSDKQAREYAAKRYEYLRQKELSKSTKVSLEELGAKIKEDNLKSLPVILKADTQGSLEAIRSSLDKLKNEEIKVDIIHMAIGGITQGDIALAAASEDSVVIGFNVRPTGDVKEKAKEKKVLIKTYNIIYNLLDDVKAALSGLMSPIISEEHLGQAQIRQVVNIPKVGQIAGCMVTDGSIVRGAKIRLIRDGVVVYEGNVSSLKRFKDDVKEVTKGYECGVGIEGCNDLREGDYIESYKEVEKRATLE